MTKKSIKKLTLRQFLKMKGIKLYQIEKVCEKTMNNILRGSCTTKFDKDYRWRWSYFPREDTLSKLSLELKITYEELVRLIENQYKN